MPDSREPQWEAFFKSGKILDYLSYKGVAAAADPPATDGSEHYDYTDGYCHPGTNGGRTG